MGSINSFAIFAGLIALQGVLASAADPATYSLVRDYFPAKSRGTANSIVSVAPYIGSGLSSMSVLFIH